VTNLWPYDASDDWRARVEAALKGTFVLERELRGGSMSRVFVGTESALGRRVVIKMLMSGGSAGEREAEFRREAVTAARLHHPHIVPIFTIGTVLGAPYYTMPFIDGESLRARLDRGGALPLDAALRILREIGSALGFAHELGVIHRDVKPENIVLERVTGRALLGDFGIACALGDSRRDTPAGMTVGTPVYMSPEQVDGLELDGRTDTYSLGLVAWEMLVGVRPWSGTSLDDVMYRQKHVPLPPLNAYASHVPRQATDAIERALCKNRDERWASVYDFLDAIEPGGHASSRQPGELSRPIDFETDNWTAGAQWQDSAEIRPPDRADPVAVKTVPMSARREASSPRRPARIGVPPSSAAFRESRTLEERQERRRQRTRWIAAACGAALVTTGLVAAMSGRRTILRWSSTLGDVISDGASATAAASVQIDTVASSAAAANLVSIDSVPPAALATDTLPPSPLDAPVWPAAVARPHLATRVPEAGLSSRDAIRARAATATLSLQAYQAAVAGAAPLQSPGPSPIAPQPVASDTNAPATGVRVPPRHSRAERAAARSSIPDSSSPAVGVRVRAPRTP
jgi:serine/threonine protein kinase